MILDAKTMFVVAAVGYILYGLIMLAYRAPSFDRRAIDIWIWGQLLKGGGLLLIVMRELVPFALSVGGNSVFMIGMGAELLAYAVYAGHRNQCPRVIALIFVSVAVFNLLLIVTPQDAPRNGPIVVSGMILALFSLLCAFALWANRRERSIVQYLLIAGHGAFALGSLARAASGLATAQLPVFANTPQTQWLTLVGFVLMIVGGFCFLLMVKEDSDRVLLRMATCDELTGLANRRSFTARAEDLHKLCRRTVQAATLIVLDIDHFKRINDTYGHAAGDAVLRAVALALQESLREIDILGRIGGEEFAIVLPGTDIAQAGATAERLRMAVADQVVSHAGQALGVTVSLGLAPLTGASLDAAMARADGNLYVAKAQGRNRVVFVKDEDITLAADPYVDARSPSLLPST